MPLPVPNLDDRRFDDLVAEARLRLGAHLPELTQIAPGDPLHGIVDLFAWLTETILYRANLIPERQRRVFLNLLQIPLRPARAARGLVCVDAGPTSVLLPPLLDDGSQLRAGPVSLTTVGELQPTCLSLQVLVKRLLTSAELEAMGITPLNLHQQFDLDPHQTPVAFRPHRFLPGQDILHLDNTPDQAFYLACLAPAQLESQLALVRKNLAGILINLALAPADEQPAAALEQGAVSHLNPRRLVWELIIRDENGQPAYLPLEPVGTDTSAGGRRAGIVRLRLPKNTERFDSFASTDPLFAGKGTWPPELVEQVDARRVAFWLRLRCPEDPALELGYLGLNGVEVRAQGLRRDQVVGIGNGQPDQVIVLPDRNIDADSLLLEVEENGAWVPWDRVDFLAGQSPDARVFQLDAPSGLIQFGDGISAGRRPPVGVRIRAALYLSGGGLDGNLPAGAVKEIVDGSNRHKLRHEWPLQGGRDAETVEQAEKRIPQFLTHRNRAITREDFRRLAESNPVNPVARAEVRPGFLPGVRLNAARDGVPGVVSLFVLPPGHPSRGHLPKPTQGLLKDVFGYLINRITIGTELYVLSPQFIPLAVSVKVSVRDPATETQTLQDVQAALIDYLWPLAPGGARGQGWNLGDAVRASELATQVARVDGVLAVNALSLFRQGQSDQALIPLADLPPPQRALHLRWRRLGSDELFRLEHYQLPELLAVRVETGSGIPELPTGIGPLLGAPGSATGSDGSGSGGDHRQPVPVPVIPDLC